MIDEAIRNITEKPIKSTTLERLSLLHAADSLYSDLPEPIKYGKAILHLLSKCSLPINETDLILGRICEKVLSEEEEEEFLKYERGGNSARPSWVRDFGHRSFWWEGLLEYGIPGLRTRAVRELDKRQSDGKTEKERLDFLEGIVLIYDAFTVYLSRYADAADSVGLTDAAEACRALTHRAPQSFREALQLLWTVELVYCAYIATNPSLAIGRMDLFLERIYENDRATGNLDENFARLLILDFYRKHNLILGRGEHQMSVTSEESFTGWARNACYDSPQYMMLGGRRRDGSYLDGSLTHLFVEMIEPRFKNPVAIIRYAPDMQKKCPRLWHTVADKARQSASLMIYNEQDVISGYIKSGVDADDAFDFEQYGCNHSALPGIEAMTGYRGYLPLTLLLEILNRWVRDGYEPKSTDELFSAVRAAAREQSADIIDRLFAVYSERMNNPTQTLEMTDAFYRYSVPNASSYNNYGSKYIFANLHICSYASFIDTLCAVDELVIKKKKMTLAHLMEAAGANYDGYAVELALSKRAPKLGSDNPVANEYAKRLMTDFTDDVYALAKERLSKIYPPAYGDITATVRPIVRISMESDNGHRDGLKMGATPDGRKAGEVLSQNTAPALGASVRGLTARLCSVASIPFDRIVAGAQNLSIQPKYFKGDDGLSRLASVMGGYFDMGGLQLQITATDPDILIAAQKNPDAHRDLMVRVTGYSAVFVDMEKHAQDDIIKRDLMDS